jgi:DNA-binding MarR family transcriptional regulator/RimJ/RimL family protein N-acetyltransferase
MASLAERTELVRAFNRFYTRQIGLLREGLLKTPFSLTQARVLYELGRRSGVRPTQLVADLDLDPGYLSRLLKGFERQGLVKRSASRTDARATHLALTARGRKEFEGLDARSRAETGEVLASLSEPRQQRLVESMTAIRDLLSPDPAGAESFAVRTHRPGDIGWVVARHGEIYARDYQWDVTFEGFVAEIAGKFLTHFDAQRERCWIAEQKGERLGCIFLVKQSQSVAKLRLLLVESWTRCMGVGTRLVAECLAFARQAGYRKITLWTNAGLDAARRIYERAGFRLVREEPHHSFGHDLVGQFWELKL